MNVLTFDIEEWFHLLDFDATRSEDQWNRYEVRIHQNVDRLLEILDDTDSKATFFIIGWIAKKYPEVVKKIAQRYEIGSHTMNHQLVWQLKPEEFREEVSSSIKLLEDITGKPVKAFRSPGFSLRESEAWALDILAENNIELDASVFPARHAHGGMPSYPSPVPSIIKHGEAEIKEFPVSIKTIFGKHIIFSGGGYFRLFPYWLIKKWANEHPEYLLSYIHPRDLDAEQPMIEGLPLTRKFKSYVGLKGAEKKLRKMMRDFKFTDMQTAAKQIDWTKAPIVEI